MNYHRTHRHCHQEWNSHGQTFDADIIITATGLKVKFLGKATMKVDGSEAIQLSDKFLWHGSMLSDVPQSCSLMEFTNACWALGRDAQPEMLVRLLQNIQRRGDINVLPKMADASKVTEMHLMNLSSGHIKSAMKDNLVPEGGDVVPATGELIH